MAAELGLELGARVVPLKGMRERVALRLAPWLRRPVFGRVFELWVCPACGACRLAEQAQAAYCRGWGPGAKAHPAQAMARVHAVAMHDTGGPEQ
jgi:hypothetical protein